MNKFPRELAKYVHQKWFQLVDGDYIEPDCPSEKILRNILEICYLVSCATEEGRFPKFNVVAMPSNAVGNELIAKGQWIFKSNKKFTVSEMLRLVPVTDLRKSAVLIGWNVDGVQIYGLVDLGTSWHRARIGLGYNYTYPNSLIVQVDRPGRVKVYQGRYQIASLADGRMIPSDTNWMHLFLHESANSGCAKMNDFVQYPDYEPPREFMEFQFMALWNTYVAIANSISLAQHGGMLIIASNLDPFIEDKIDLKYSCPSDKLRDAFISFINARHIMGDLIEIDNDGYWVPTEAINKAGLEIRDRYEELVEATRFVAALSGCDGAIVITDDLKLAGFGAEIKAALKKGTEVYEIEKEYGENHKPCDVEQFGMRHRSAVKFSSQVSDCCILAVSQDGPISGIWNSNNNVRVKRNVNLTNMNIPLG